MISVGITGGIGSGKSTVARIFEVLGIPVYYADDAAKRIMNEDPELRQAIIDASSRSYLYQRSAATAACFPHLSSTTRKNWNSSMPSFIPPLSATASAGCRHRPPLMPSRRQPSFFESGSAANLDYIIGVYAPTALRIHRAMHRDKITREASAGPHEQADRREYQNAVMQSRYHQ